MIPRFVLGATSMSHEHLEHLNSIIQSQNKSLINILRKKSNLKKKTKKEKFKVI